MLTSLKLVLQQEAGAVDVRFGLYAALIMTVLFTAVNAVMGS